MGVQNMEKLDELRQAIDMAETVLEFKEDEKIRQQLNDLRKQEAMLRGRIMEWSV